MSVDKIRYPGLSERVRDMESQTECGWFDDPRKENGFIDLRPFADDKTVLKNPHKGWFWHFIDNGFRHGFYRDRTKPGDHVEYFPGMNHLYLRFDWSDAEKTEGVYEVLTCSAEHARFSRDLRLISATPSVSRKRLPAPSKREPQAARFYFPSFFCAWRRRKAMSGPGPLLSV